MGERLRPRDSWGKRAARREVEAGADRGAVRHRASGIDPGAGASGSADGRWAGRRRRHQPVAVAVRVRAAGQPTHAASEHGPSGRCGGDLTAAGRPNFAVNSQQGLRAADGAVVNRFHRAEASGSVLSAQRRRHPTCISSRSDGASGERLRCQRSRRNCGSDGAQEGLILAAQSSSCK